MCSCYFWYAKVSTSPYSLVEFPFFFISTFHRSMQAFEFAYCLKLTHLHTSQSTQTDSSPHQQQQTVSSPNPLQQAAPEYEEVIQLSENVAYKPVQSIEMKANEAYQFVGH